MNKLALNGANPVRSTMLPYARQCIDEDDRRAVNKVLCSDWITTGPMVKEFENVVKSYTGALEGVAVNSGTAALHASVWAAGVSKGDEVIVPAISFVASANCVLYVGAKPVFADLLPDTLNISPIDIERRITSRTKAIIAVDFAGHPCNYDEINKIAKTYGLTVIRDAAHSLGAIYKGTKVGTLPDMTILSFHPAKHITTGEGGMVLTSNVDVAKRIRSFRHHGIDFDFHQRNQVQSWQYDINVLGYNYRISDINCALGINQMLKLDKWLECRCNIAASYNEGFADLDSLQLPVEKSECKSAWHLYVVRIRKNMLSADRGQLFKALRAENIGVNVHYIPIPYMSYYASLGYKRGNWPVAEENYERMITLPMYPSMSEQDVQDTIDAVRKVIKAYRI